MKALLDAIKSRFDGEATLGAGYVLVTEEAPEFEMPTALMTLLDSEVDEVSGSNSVETFNIQFDLYHNDDMTIAAHQTFSVIGATLLGVQRLGTRYLSKEGVDHHGNPVWHCSAEYRFKVRH
jgi:hypothetical protein